MAAAREMSLISIAIFTLLIGLRKVSFLFVFQFFSLHLNQHGSHSVQRQTNERTWCSRRGVRRAQQDKKKMAAAAAHQRLVKWRDMWPYVTFSLFIIYRLCTHSRAERIETSRFRRWRFQSSSHSLALANDQQTRKLCFSPRFFFFFLASSLILLKNSLIIPRSLLYCRISLSSHTHTPVLFTAQWVRVCWSNSIHSLCTL